MIKGIIFDIGGVLASDVSEYLFEHDGGAVTKKYGLDYELTKEISSKLWKKYAFTKTDEGERWEEVEQEYWNEFKELSGLKVENSELISITSQCAKPTKGMNELLTWIKSQDLDLMICSNNTEFFYQHQQKNVGFEGIFDSEKIALSCRYGIAKDDEPGTMFKAIEKEMKFPKENYLFIDDRSGNIKAGLKFGVIPIYFPAEAEFGHIYIKEIILKMIKQ